MPPIKYETSTITAGWGSGFYTYTVTQEDLQREYEAFVPAPDVRKPFTSRKLLYCVLGSAL